MNRVEFLEQFREALDGKVTESVIQENVNYYRSYIDSQTAGGRTEEEVLKMLGDPRLLAKTIEESSKFASEMGGRGGQSDEFESYGNYGYNNHEDAENEYGGGRFRLQMWLRTFAVAVVVIFVLLIVFKVFVLSAPFILTFMAVSFLIKVVTEHRK